MRPMQWFQTFKQKRWHTLAVLGLLVLLAGIGAGCTAQAEESAKSVDQLYDEMIEMIMDDSANAVFDSEGNALNDLYTFIQEQFGSYYLEKQEEWKRQGIPNATQSFTIDSSNYKGSSPNANVRIGTYEGRSNVLIFDNDRNNYFEYEFEVPEEGLYEIVVTYQNYRDPDTTKRTSYRPATLTMMIDGEIPFREARAIKFPRYFKDTFPLQFDKYGDHIRPRPIEITEWKEFPIRDHDDSYNTPLTWHLTKGKHTLRFEGYSSIVIDKIEFRPPTQLRTYEEYRAMHPEMTDLDVDLIEIEAEEMMEKNEVSIQMDADQDAFMSPMAHGRRIFNYVGGNRWAKGGETIKWEVDVPESGWYKIAYRALNNIHSNKTSFRKIKINGEVPYVDLVDYGTPFSSSWQGHVIADENGEPYAIYLEKGTNIIEMSVNYAPLKPVQILLEKVTQELGMVSRDLQVLTRGEVDRNRTWDIVNNFPEIPEMLRVIRGRLELMADMWLAVNKDKDNNYQSILTSMQDIDDLLDKVNEIPYRMDNISMIQSKIGTLASQITSQPIALDRIYILPYNKEFPRMKANFWETTKNGFMNFIRSFTEDDKLTANDDSILNVWMYYGRDYVNLLQELADQYFTPETGIPVKIDLLPREDLLVLSNAVNKTPDVALGIGEGRPSEFAFRDAAYDLSQFEGFDELAKNFSPGALLPYYYDGGYYAIPETMQFKMLYYRIDIMDRLGLEVPDTWDDVYNMLPTLQQNGYNFFIPLNEYLTFVYQNGADFYANDGMTTGLDSPEGFRAFKMVTELFSVYGIDRQVPSFYQHFRDGTMPIGFTDLNHYLQMLVAAPELTGWWGMAPMPGIKNEDGVVERWSGGNIGMLSQGLGGFGGAMAGSGAASQTAAMIMKKADNPEWGWEFLKWWMSPEIQEQFGSELEGFHGPAFRWNTANLEAFTRLPWTNEELEVILEQWQWYKSMVNVPGSYFIPRELSNAWNRTVVDGMNYRNSLEIAIMNINRELVRKQQEFGYRDEQGNVIKTFNLPQFDEPWEGVQRFVND